MLLAFGPCSKISCVYLVTYKRISALEIKDYGKPSFKVMNFSFDQDNLFFNIWIIELLVLDSRLV